MKCHYPLQGWKSRHRNPTGKRSVVFDMKEGLHDFPLTVRCGRCIGCRIDYGQQWSIRMMNEAQMHESNCFITLTYDDEHLPKNRSLKLEDFQLFMKRLRKHSDKDGKRIKFYHAGEYGSRGNRPHYHACLFGYDFPDKEHWATRGNYKVWRSELLDTLWGKGTAELGTVTHESAGYVASYMIDKFKGDEEQKLLHYMGLKPEYATMSKGIGRDFYEKFKDELFLNDSVIVNGQEVKLPRRYDEWFAEEFPGKMAKIKRERVKRHYDEPDWSQRLEAHRQITDVRRDLFRKREL